MVILDTCAVIELIKPTPTFTSKTFKQMNSDACILSISFAEIACKIKLGKLELSLTSEALYEQFIAIKNIKIIDINVALWLSSINLNWPANKDPADRLITAFAIEKQLSIVTTDKKMKEFYAKVIW